jgi:hypothetical protein
MHLPDPPINFIRIQYHERSRLPNKIIPLDESEEPHDSSSEISTNNEPYAPFPTLADFEFIERAVLAGHHADDVNFIYKNLHNERFAERCKLQLRSFEDGCSLLDEVTSIYQNKVSWKDCECITTDWYSFDRKHSACHCDEPMERPS